MYPVLRWGLLSGKLQSGLGDTDPWNQCGLQYLCHQPQMKRAVQKSQGESRGQDRSERRSHSLGKAPMIGLMHTHPRKDETCKFCPYTTISHTTYGPTTHVPGDENTSTSRQSTRTCSVSSHLLQSETNVSRVATAWARKFTPLNTKQSGGIIRTIGNANYQREDCFSPG